MLGVAAIENVPEAIKACVIREVYDIQLPMYTRMLEMNAKPRVPEKRSLTATSSKYGRRALSWLRLSCETVAMFQLV